MELKLYFYHHEISVSPESIFKTFNDDTELINALEKLHHIEYTNGVLNDRTPGTKAVLKYDESSIETEIVVYENDRRFEIESKVPAGTLVTMFNIVPVENHSEVTISTKFFTDSPVSFALYALKIPRIKKQFDGAMKRLTDH